MATINFGVTKIVQGGGNGGEPAVRNIAWCSNTVSTALALTNTQENIPIGAIDSQTTANFYTLSSGGIVLPTVGSYRALIAMTTDNTDTTGDARGTGTITPQLDGVDIPVTEMRFYMREVQFSGSSMIVPFDTTQADQVLTIDLERNTTVGTTVPSGGLVVEIELFS